MNHVTSGQLGDVVTATVTAVGAGQTRVSDITMTIVSATFESIADAHWPRESHAGAAYDDKVWSVGGKTDLGSTPPLVEKYDPKTDAWMEIAGSEAPFGEDRVHSGCQAGDTVYMWSDGLYSYNMATNTWSDLSTATGQPDPNDWDLDDSAWVFDPDAGLCYATGGQDANTGDESKAVSVYNPATNSWLAKLPDFTNGRL